MDLINSVKWVSRKENPELINNFYFNEINWWILVRYHILLKFKSPDKYYNRKSKSQTEVSPIKRVIKLRSINKKLFKHFKNLEKNEFFFSSSLSYYTDKIDSKKYNRHIDPFIELLLDKNNCLKLEGDDFKTNVSDDFHNKTLFYSSSLIQELNWWNNTNRDLKRFTNWISELDKKYDLGLNIDMFVWHMTLIEDYAKFYSNILLKTKPKIVFIVCYYSPHNFGLLLAARQLKIKTADIQHGKQGIHHYMYSDFYFLPNYTKRLMPDYFLNWGNPSSSNINNYMNNIHCESIPQAFTLGNLWVQRWKEKEQNVERALPSSFLKYSSIVLFAAQPVETEFSIDFISQLANEFPDILILYRFHPAQKKDMDFIQEKLSNNLNVEFEYANSESLYKIISTSSAVITLWSTVAFEALEFAKKAIIIHPTGKELFKIEIENGDFYYLENPNELADVLKSKNLKSDLNFIISDSKIIKENFVNFNNQIYI